MKDGFLPYRGGEVVTLSAACVQPNPFDRSHLVDQDLFQRFDNCAGIEPGWCPDDLAEERWFPGSHIDIARGTHLATGVREFKDWRHIVIGAVRRAIRC